MGRLLSARRRLADEAGTGVVTALSISLAVFVLGTVWTTVAVHQVESSGFERNREQALNAAEAGINLAVSELAGDIDWAGTAGVVTLGDDSGQFEVTVAPVDPADPDDLDRYIVAKGYAPSKTSRHRAQRQLEQQVELVPTDGFSFALFASPGGITGQNNSTITGDVYSAEDVNLAQFAKVFGDITSVGAVTTSNNSSVGGRIHAGTNVVVQNANTTVQGDVWAGGFSAGTPNATIGGTVSGNVQARGTVVVSGGTVNGTVVEGSPPPEPAVLTQPAFTWDASNYASASSWTSMSAFDTYWNANKSSFQGHHRITVADSTANRIALDERWTMGGDVTIVSDGPIQLTRDVVNGTSSDVTLVLISLSNVNPAIELSNNVSIPASVNIVLYAPNGPIDFSQLKDFHGVVYGEEIRLSQQFTLSYAAPEIPGFAWDASSAVHFDVEVRTFREVEFGT